MSWTFPGARFVGLQVVQEALEWGWGDPPGRMSGAEGSRDTAAPLSLVTFKVESGSHRGRGLFRFGFHSGVNCNLLPFLSLPSFHVSP